MKKIVVLLACFALCLTLTGCGSGVPQEEYDRVVSERDALQAEIDSMNNASNDSSESTVEYDNETSSSAQNNENAAFDESAVISQLEVTEYSLKSSGWYYAFMVIKNNSAFDLDISVNINFYNDEGNIVGADSDNQSAFGAGTEIILYFMPDEDFASTEYELSVEQEEWYECAVSDLTYESTPAKDKEIVSVTNNGDAPIEYVKGCALFFNGENVVDYDDVFFDDNDYELKPGKTITKELACYEEYDSVKFFFTGRRDK